MPGHRTKKVATILGLSLMLPLLAGCGFTPIYADSDRTLTTSLASIALVPIRSPEQASYVLENELRDFISNDAGTPQYDLEVVLKERRKSVAVTSQAQTARFEYNLEGEYTLTNRETGKKYRNEKSAVTSYGIVKSQYASYVGQEDAIRKAAITLADKMETDLVLYFKGQVNGVEIEANETFKTPTVRESLKEQQLQEILGEDY